MVFREPWLFLSILGSMAGNLSYSLLINALIKLLSNEQLKDIPDDILVRRTFSLDTGRHLAVSGCYVGFFAIPDR